MMGTDLISNLVLSLC